MEITDVPDFPFHTQGLALLNGYARHSDWVTFFRGLQRISGAQVDEIDHGDAGSSFSRTVRWMKPAMNTLICRHNMKRVQQAMPHQRMSRKEAYYHAPHDCRTIRVG